MNTLYYRAQAAVGIVITLLLCTVFVSAPVSAQVATSDTDIAFTENQGPTRPVDPENPNITDPEKPEVPGALSILWVSGFSFGSLPVSTAAETYYIVTERPNLQVVDLRGNHSGWTVSAKLSKFVEVVDNNTPDPQDEAAQESLKGISLYIANGRLSSASGQQYAPTAVENVKLTPGATGKPVLTASTGRGSGLWVERWYSGDGLVPEENYVYLEVPAGAAAVGSHLATITWTIEDTPQE